MHDPMTQAFVIPYPWFKRFSLRKDGSKGDRYWIPFITIWHVDPCKGRGGDDSCGWFMRSHHGNPKTLEKIRKRFDEDFDRVFKYFRDDYDGSAEKSGRTPDSIHHMGYFCPNGEPNFSVSAIVLNLFFTAASVYFECDGRSNWKKARQFMEKNLFDILLFAENPCDSLRSSIVGTFRPTEKWNRNDAIENYASVIYGWILRNQRPWWKHPRWHVHHWKIQVHPWQTLRRWLLSRCCKCGKRFKWGESPCTDQWHHRDPKFLRGEEGIYHMRCGGHMVAANPAMTPAPE